MKRQHWRHITMWWCQHLSPYTASYHHNDISTYGPVLKNIFVSSAKKENVSVSVTPWIIHWVTGSSPVRLGVDQNRTTDKMASIHLVMFFFLSATKAWSGFHADGSSESTCEKGEEWSVQHQNSSRVSAERLTNTWTLGTFFYPEWVSEVNNVRRMFESSLIIRVSYLVSFLLSFCLKVMIKMCFCCWEKTINELY